MATTTVSPAGEFSRGKTILVLAVLIGCFAVLWPQVFYPMFSASIPRLSSGDPDEVCCDVISERDTNAYKIMTEICNNIIRQESKLTDTGQGQPILKQQQQPSKIRKPTAILCRNEILKNCGVDILILLQENAAITKEYKESLGQLRSFNTSHCMKINYGVDFGEIGLPHHIKGPFSHPSHMRPERPLRSDMLHPALREKGRAIPSAPRRTIEREARPGPVPGVRPPVGGAGHIPTAPKGSGTMGIIMPMYTIGIVCFFVYTLLKILFKKTPEESNNSQAPIVKDFGMDPEHRKFVFSEEYTEGSEKSIKDAYNKEDRDLGVRRKSSGGKGRFHEDKRRLEIETDPGTDSPHYPDESEQNLLEGDNIEQEQIDEPKITLEKQEEAALKSLDKIKTTVTTKLLESQPETEPFSAEKISTEILPKEHVEIKEPSIQTLTPEHVEVKEPSTQTLTPELIEINHPTSKPELIEMIEPSIQTLAPELIEMNHPTSKPELIEIIEPLTQTSTPELLKTTDPVLTPQLVEAKDVISTPELVEIKDPTSTPGLVKVEDLIYVPELIEVKDPTSRQELIEVKQFSSPILPSEQIKITEQIESTEQPKESIDNPDFEILPSPSETVLPTTCEVKQHIDPNVIGEVTKQDLTSAALFFDQTFEEDEDEPLDQTNKPYMDATPQSPAPEIIEFANNLGKQIIEDAISTTMTSINFLHPTVNNLDKLAVDNEFPTLTTEPISTSIKISEECESPNNVIELTVNNDPINKPKISLDIKNILPIPIEISVKLEAVTEETQSQNNISIVEPIVSNLEDLCLSSNIESGNIETLKIPQEKAPELDFIQKQEFQHQAPVITLIDDQRKNSEPIMTRKKSDVQITPIEDISGNNLFSDMLGGYVTMADESGSRPPKGFLRNLKSGVEICSFDDGLEPMGETSRESLTEAERLSQRVMSMDSNDSVVTVKEFELEIPTDIKGEELQVEIQPQIHEEKVEEKTPQVKIMAELSCEPDEELCSKIDTDVENRKIPSEFVQLEFEPIDVLSQPATLKTFSDSEPLNIKIGMPLDLICNISQNQDQETPSPDCSNVVDILTKLPTTPTKLSSSTFESSVNFNIEPFVEESNSTPIPIDSIVESTPVVESKSVSFISTFQFEPETNERDTAQVNDPQIVQTIEFMKEDIPDETIEELFVSEICEAAQDVMEKTLAASSLAGLSEDAVPHEAVGMDQNDFRLTDMAQRVVTDNQEGSKTGMQDLNKDMESSTTEQIVKSLEPETSTIVTKLELEIIPGEPLHNNIQKHNSLEEITPAHEPEMILTEEVETEFIPEAEPLSVPPIESSNSPLQVAVVNVAIETISSEIQKETEDKPVETPESEIPSTTSSSTDSFTPPTDNQTEDKLSAKPHEILGDVQEVSIDQPSIVAAAAVEPAQGEKVKSVASVNGSSVSETDLGVEGRSGYEAENKAQADAPKKESGQRDRDARDIEIDMLRKRLEETEAAMERIVAQMGTVSDRLSPSILAQVLKAQGVRQEDLEKRKDSDPISKKSTSQTTEAKSAKPSSVRSQSSVEKEVKFQLPPKDSTEEEDEEGEEEEEVVRPPTPPRTLSKKSKHRSDPSVLSSFAQELSETILQQAAITAAKAQGTGGHRETVSVVGFEETAEMQSGEKWDDRTPTPTFRMATPPVPHRPPTPPEDIPSIFLEGPMPTAGQQLIVSDQISEIEGDYPDDDFDQISNPVILSGKVTLSVISGGGGCSDELTEASSLSYDDRAQAGSNMNKSSGSKKDGLASAIKTEKGLSSAKKPSPASSPDMEDYEVIKKGGFSYDEDNDDVDITSYMTAETDGEGQQKEEDTAGDMSEMDGLDGRNEDLPHDNKDEE